MSDSREQDTCIPVVDLFAGPGGLGEGFSACPAVSGRKFRINLSIEMDPVAHRTLQLRAFFRKFQKPPKDYWRFMRGEIDEDALFRAHPKEATAARSEARCLELSAKTAPVVKELVKQAIGKTKSWVLIGGPPCQAYSLVERSRNRGISDYDANKDRRHVLYVEYLQILADHAPPVFVMENVKGLLSARYRDGAMFERIREDLENPLAAMNRLQRKTIGNQASRYTLLALSPDSEKPEATASVDFLVRAEEHGLPQARHRVIIVGIRRDRALADLRLKRATAKTVREALDGLPALVPGVTDKNEEVGTLLTAAIKSRRFHRISTELRTRIFVAAQKLTEHEAGRGAEFVPGENLACRQLGGWSNHSSRAHILADLERYLFASAFASLHNRSPLLNEFPQALLPDHANVGQALTTGHFADRFRVQVADKPSTTITSHISKDGHYYIHPDSSQCRSLTVREAARLQTFPDDYFFCGPRTAQYHQVGNAVPPQLAKMIAARLLPLFV